MSPKKTSKASRGPAGVDPSDGKKTDEAGDSPAPQGVDKTAESYDDSLDAILLQAGARPPEAASAKALGSKTLMGIGLEALNLAALRPALAPAAAEDESPSDVTPHTPSDETLNGASAGSVDDTQVTSLLDEVAQALNIQASEHRDRARGKLPGMPGPDSAESPPADAASPSAARDQMPSKMSSKMSSKMPSMMALTDGAEFEDPDDGPTSLTPGVMSFVPDVPEPEDLDLVGVSPEDEEVVLGPAGAHKSGAASTENRSGKLPPIPGLSGPVSAAVGPPPGVGRTSTPPSGLQSGRVRQPTPAPGTPSLPPPPSGRLSLPPGMVSAPVVPLPQPSQLDMSASATLDASRRSSISLSGARSDRSSKIGSGNRVTQPVILANPGSALPTMPTVLAAQVKIATLSLAGLIAVTFAGGLLVGMLVWRGQGREPVRSEHARVTTTAPVILPAPAAPAIAPAEATPPPTTVAAEAPKAGAATAGAAAVGTAAAVVAAPLVAGKPAPASAPAPAVPTVAAPLAAGPVDGEPKVAAPRAAALRQPPRPRRVATVPTVADTAALFPKAGPAPAAAPKTVASNAPAKPAPKAKGKAAWHDPFAD